MIAYAQLNTAGLTTHTGHRTLKRATLPHRTKREIYLTGYENAGSLAPTALFTRGKNFYRTGHFLGTFFYLCGIEGNPPPALPLKHPKIGLNLPAGGLKQPKMGVYLPANTVKNYIKLLFYC